jgi:PAS domain S-box-containing protein
MPAPDSRSRHSEGGPEGLRAELDEARREVDRAHRAQHIARIGGWEWDVRADRVVWSDELYRIFGLTPGEFEATFAAYQQYLHPDDRARVVQHVQEALRSHQYPSLTHRVLRPDGTTRWVYSEGRVELGADGTPARLTGIAQDITERYLADLERRHTEGALLENQKRLSEAQEIAHFGSWEWNITQNTVHWSDELYRIYGLMPGEFGATYEGYMARIHPDDRARVHDAVQRSYRTLSPFEFEERVVRPSGEVRWLQSHGRITTDARGQPVRMTGSCQDITERKRADVELAARAAALERSNEELEQFAYVASHDLQEPLRTVASYTQLLERRIAGGDAQAGEYARLINDGVHRMQNLITDLLAYSRIGRRAQPLQATPLAGALDDALASLAGALKDSGAFVTKETLPAVAGDRSQLAQVFQNLLGNAIKFRGPEPLRVHVGAVREDEQWIVSVRDNGIGVDPAHFDKMFELFQRLHSRERYPGTGLGLAICKKIVTRHGGRIWVASDGPGKGATFSFTLPGTIAPE